MSKFGMCFQMLLRQFVFFLYFRNVWVFELELQMEKYLILKIIFSLMNIILFKICFLLTWSRALEIFLSTENLT